MTDDYRLDVGATRHLSPRYAPLMVLMACYEPGWGGYCSIECACLFMALLTCFLPEWVVRSGLACLAVRPFPEGGVQDACAKAPRACPSPRGGGVQ